jgi:hypothetical protein
VPLAPPFRGWRSIGTGLADVVVDMPMTDEQWAAFARDLQRALARVAPEWTDANVHDPGTTMLEVISYALTDLQYRSGALDDRARVLARAVAERASELAAPASSHQNDDCGPGLQRVNYAFGVVLGVDDFNTEQDYLRGRLMRRNRLLHGTGIATGLAVTVEHDSGGSRVVIAPGLALDPAGNEIFVEQPCHLALPPQGADLLVLLHYAERPCRWAPVVAGSTVDTPDGSSDGRPTRIVETFRVALAAAPTADSVAIARLRQARGRWRVDARFEAMRLD